MSFHSQRNSEFNIFTPKKSFQKTKSLKSFFGNNFINRTKKESKIESKNSIKKKKKERVKVMF